VYDSIIRAPGCCILLSGIRIVLQVIILARLWRVDELIR
jgi:hypothetical protein